LLSRQLIAASVGAILAYPERQDEVAMQTKSNANANCGFLCHVVVILIGTVYVASILKLPEDAILKLPNWAIITPEADRWSVTGSAILIVLFFAAPVLYGVLNALSVPRVDAMESLCDSYTRLPPPSEDNVEP
jgi:hypothetical protein